MTGKGGGRHMTKIAVCGKGGSGKSSIVTLLAKGLRERGYRVLVVDSDESNPGLCQMLGFEERPAPLLELVGGKKRVFPTFSKGSAPSQNVLAQARIPIKDIPHEYIVERDGVRLVCIGKILQSLEGCACPMGALSREFLKRLYLQEAEVAIVDLEAGIEHFGRGVESSVDSLLVVVEPSFDSLVLAEKMNTLAAQVEIDSIWTILNKVPSEEIGAQLRDTLEKKGIVVIGSIGYDPEVFRCGLGGGPLQGSKAQADLARILDQLL